MASDDAAVGLAPGRLQLPAMLVLVAPDCYGDSLSAVEAAAAIATGLDPVTSGRSVHRRPAVRRRPGLRRGAGQPAGGEAAAAGVRAAGHHGGGRVGVRSRLGDRLPGVRAGLRPGPAGRSAHARRPRWRPTAGESGSSSPRRCGPGRRRIVVGLGGSACTDGGQGMIAELGGLDAAREQLADVELIAASDIEYPLLGPVGGGQGFRAAEGRRHGRPSRRSKSDSRRGRSNSRRRPDATSAPSRARAPPAASAPGCSRSAAGASPGAAIIAEHTHLADDLDVGGADRHR